MISQEDLKLIGQEVGKIIEDNVMPQFQGIHDRMDTFDERMDKLDGKVDQLDGRMDKLDGKVDQLDGRMDTFDGRMYKLEALADKLLLGILDLQATAKETEKRLTRLEEIAERTFLRMDTFMKKVETNEVEVIALRAGLARAEERITVLERKLQIA